MSLVQGVTILVHLIIFISKLIVIIIPALPALEALTFLRVCAGFAG
jgi:hypothetical protein